MPRMKNGKGPESLFSLYFMPKIKVGEEKVLKYLCIHMCVWYT